MDKEETLIKCAFYLSASASELVYDIMQERTQDPMAYVRNYGIPELFITYMMFLP